MFTRIFLVALGLPLVGTGFGLTAAFGIFAFIGNSAADSQAQPYQRWRQPAQVMDRASAITGGTRVGSPAEQYRES